MPLPREHLLDELATAYIQGIAARAGGSIAASRLDFGVDGTLRQLAAVAGHGYVPLGYAVDFQLKGTTRAEIEGDAVKYDLRARNYNLIVQRERRAIPYPASRKAGLSSRSSALYSRLLRIGGAGSAVERRTAPPFGSACRSRTG